MTAAAWRSHDRFYLGLALATIALSLALRYDGERVRAPGGIRLPGMCASKSLFGFDCPGCGLTRSFVALAHGDLRGAIALHAVGPAFFAFAVVQVPYRLWRRARERGLDPDAQVGPRSSWLGAPGVALVLALVARWAYLVATGAIRVGGTA